ncbi:MAG: fumarylacetoacetate hydrolase family protein [Armatimonadota bacterium]|nr:fumarylacetoacetate hydrolase family protein [Armatimonadota bacterium]
MRIVRFRHPRHGVRIGLMEEEAVYDLTAADPAGAGTLGSALTAGSAGLAGAAERAREAGPVADAKLLAPIEEQEVWAAGVTYRRSREARVEESVGGGSFYDRVYAAERPELFFKATPNRTAGPDEPVCIRRDSRWNVPEPEVALVLTPELRVAGYTIGNDMSSRDIEGENPLYLPQAKVYLGCCALGPAVLLAEPGAQPCFAISLAIYRGGAVVFRGETSTDQMKRTFADLVAFLGRANAFPGGVILLTGTGIVPPADFTLCEGDVVEITVSGIGILRNPVALVG